MRRYELFQNQKYVGWILAATMSEAIGKARQRNPVGHLEIVETHVIVCD